MSNALETLKAILSEKLPDDQVQALMAELTIAFGEGSVAISEDATGAVIVTGSHNINGDNNHVVINQVIDPEELVKSLRQLLQRNLNQNVSQSGELNLVVGESRDMHVGDRYTGVTPEQIRIIVQEMALLQSSLPNSFFDASQDGQGATEDLPFRKLVLDPTTLQAINARLAQILHLSR